MAYMFLRSFFLTCLVFFVGLSPIWAQNSNEITTFFDLDGSKEYRTHILEGVILFEKSTENSVRYLRFLNCSAYEREFPSKTAPNLVKTINAFHNEVLLVMKGSPTDDLYLAWLARAQFVTVVLLEQKLSPDELSDWKQFVNTAAGRRSLDLYELNLAIETITLELFDARSGKPWSWPLAKLRDFSESKNLRNELNRAIDAVMPSTSKLLGKISAVPGDQQEFNEFGRDFFEKSTLIQLEIFKNLSSEDKATYRQLSNQPAYQFGRSLIRSLTPVVRKSVLKNSSEVGVSDICKELDIPNCMPATKAYEALMNYRALFRDSLKFLPYMQTFKRITNNLPEAGCP
jgi:hypothetical protein